MTAHELARELLEGPDVLVVVQKDSEGNGYSPCEGVATSNVFYQAESTWSGIVVSAQDLVDDAEENEEDEFDTYNMFPCVVIFPVN